MNYGSHISAIAAALVEAFKADAIEWRMGAPTAMIHPTDVAVMLERVG